MKQLANHVDREGIMMVRRVSLLTAILAGIFVVSVVAWAGPKDMIQVNFAETSLGVVLKMLSKCGQVNNNYAAGVSGQDGQGNATAGHAG